MKSPIASTLAIIALVSSTIAAPTEASPVERDVSELSKRTTGGVYLCSGSNWQRCDVITYTLTAGVWPCLALPSRFNGHLGSIGPDPGILCRIWTDSTCSEPVNTVTTSYPGIDNLYWHDGADHGHSAHYIGCIPCSGC